MVEKWRTQRSCSFKVKLWRLRDLGHLHKVILVFPPTGDLSSRWNALLARDRQSEKPLLPDAVRPEKTLAVIYADDLTPIVIEGTRDERCMRLRCASLACWRSQPALNQRVETVVGVVLRFGIPGRHTMHYLRTHGWVHYLGKPRSRTGESAAVACVMATLGINGRSDL
jgi:hypothetical protein